MCMPSELNMPSEIYRVIQNLKVQEIKHIKIFDFIFKVCIFVYKTATQFSES